MTTYHVGLRKHLDAFIKVKDEFIAAPYPAWSCIGTIELITEGTLVEIRVICQRPKFDQGLGADSGRSDFKIERQQGPQSGYLCGLQ